MQSQQHCSIVSRGYLDQQSWKTDEVFYLFIQSPATPALSGGCCIVTQPIPCLHLVTRQQQPFSTTLNNPWVGGSQAAKLGTGLGQGFSSFCKNI